MRYAIPRAQDQASPEYLRLFAYLDRTATLLDGTFRVPLTRVRFGWDPIVGLLPVLGDLVTAAVSLHLIGCARKLGADRRLSQRMLLNAAVDAVVGAIPIVGTVFDVLFRANERNLKLLVDHIERHRRS